MLLRLTRVANTAPGLTVCLTAWPLGTRQSGPGVLLALSAVLVGVDVVVRGFRMAVSVSGDRILVRGLLWSRTLRRADVVAVTSLPALTWGRRGGGYRHTPLVAFMSVPGTLPAVRRHQRACLERLARAVRPLR